MITYLKLGLLVLGRDPTTSSSFSGVAFIGGRGSSGLSNGLLASTAPGRFSAPFCNSVSIILFTSFMFSWLSWTAAFKVSTEDKLDDSFTHKCTMHTSIKG